jgi:predicted O-linked N-acetylglucosamine transferase (SPINDLY family)
MTPASIAVEAFRSKAAEDEAADTRPLLRAATLDLEAGDHAKAAAVFVRVLETDPANSAAWTGLATSLKRQGDLTAASDAYQTAIRLHPRVAANHFGLAEVMRRRGHLDRAIACCDVGLAVDPAIGEGHIVRAMIRRDRGEADEAVADLRLVVDANPGAAAIHALLSDVLAGLDRLEEATASLETAIAANPGDASLHRRLYSLLARQQRMPEALAAWEAFPALDPNDAEAHRAHGKLLEENGRVREAFDSYQAAIAINPRFARAYTDLAILVAADSRHDLATSIFRAVVALTPNDAGAHQNLGLSLRYQREFEDAATHFRRALALNPDYIDPRAELCQIQQQFCDWKGLESEQRALIAATRAGKLVPPFAILVAPDSTREDQLRAAWLWALTKERALAMKPFAPYPRDTSRARLRIGYVSADYHNHATAMLIVELIEKHDRARFEIFAYSFGPDDASPMRARITRAFDMFREFRGLSSAEAARRIHADDIDVLIDLKGYTLEERAEIFAARPARARVNFLGYPGTMGARFIDYLIADPIVAPMAHADAYDEKLVHLPHCYQPNDRQRPLGAHGLTRAACGLPRESFVFCCFNNSYKINATVFDAWMGLLRDIPGSVLWLFEANRVVAETLRLASAERGVAPGRIVFAPRVAPAYHLARLSLADLFLDTMPYNAHTTASEALWMGLPVLTCQGETFASRVAASLLHAVGLPELITTSLDDYAAKARDLARDPAALKRLRDTLEANRWNAPLFDSDRYTRNFEAALLQIMAIHDSGAPPAAFAVADQPAP